MQKKLIIIIILLSVLLIINYCSTKSENKITLSESSALIEKEIKNVGKLIVTEGHFSEIYNYKNSKSLFGDYLTSNKKALVIVNANVTVAYDLSKLTYNIDQTHKVLNILNIPEPELKIYPNIEYYDIQFDYFNPFEAEDHNAIKKTVLNALQKKIEASQIKSNAKDRLLSELSKFYILTSTLGWTLEYKDKPIENNINLKAIPLP